MVVRRKKKYRKYLGKRYARRGYNDRNRGAGNRGGRGIAGWRFKKQKYMKIIKEHPELFEDKKGFVPPKRRKIYAINLCQIDEYIDAWKEAGLVKEENGKLVVNLVDLGYNKLLGKGKISIPIK
ncbi:MAG TPA: 50S ribosomal protein L15, partial [Candidatus Nanopusillus sp.]|nr:50S ribosomal protein L15 [Candidatus Nanopusillus sp.]